MDLNASAEESGEGGRAKGAHPAVGDLERQPPAPRAPRTEDRLRPALADEICAAHHGRVKALRPADHVGMLAHRPPDLVRGLGQVAGEAAGREPGEAGSEVLERHAERGHAATVAAEQYLVWLEAADAGYDLEYPHLQGVARVAVAACRPALEDAHGEHSGVLTRAVAVDVPRLLAPARELHRSGSVERRVRTVLEVILGEARLLEDGAYGSQVRLLGVVRGTGDGELFVRQAESVGGAGENKGQRLEGFGRGAGVDVALRVAHGLDDVPFLVADGDAPPVDAFDQRPSPEGDERRVLGEPCGGVLALQLYSPARATIRRSTRSWATRMRAIAAGKFPSA